MADNSQAHQPASQSPLAISLLAAGIVILIVSFFWPGQSASRAAWSPEQAQAYQAASVKLHGLSQQNIGATGSNKEKALREQLAKAEAEYKQIRSQLDAAIDQPRHLRLILRIFGTLMAIAGLVLINRRVEK